MNKVIITTERLILREFNLHDTAFILQLLNSEGWIKYIGDRNVKTDEDAHFYLENGPIKSYIKNGFGLSLVLLKEDKTPIGMCGLIKRENFADIDIGFAFLPQYTGKGYANEIAKATLAYGFEQLKKERIVAITLPSNTNCIKLLEKIGMVYEKNIIDHEEELMLFASNQL